MNSRARDLRTPTAPSPAVDRAATIDLCQPALVLRALLAVQAVVLVWVLLNAAGPGLTWRVWAPAAFAGLTTVVAWLGGLCLARGLWLRAPPAVQQAVALGWGSCSAVGALVALAWAGLAPFAWAVVLGTAAAGALGAAGVWSWLSMRLRSSRPADRAARLAELQARIRPHFLFNALNAALALVRVDPERAERVLEDLSELFRGALAEPSCEVTLADEVDLARRYLAIEQVRFGDRMRLQWDIDPLAGAARLPPLVLQPLVENAVRHGIEPAAEGGEVSVRAFVRHGQAVIEVINSLPESPSRPGAGMAWANTVERLGLMHDLGAQCQAGPEGGRFVARIAVPL